MSLTSRSYFEESSLGSSELEYYEEDELVDPVKKAYDFMLGIPKNTRVYSH